MTRQPTPRFFTAFAVASFLLAAHAGAADDVAGTLITLTDTATAPNGAWCWFEDERAVIDDSDPDNRLLLVCSVSWAPSGAQESGDVDLLWLNIDTGSQGEFELHNRFQRDDHASPALWIRPDGRYVASYSRHGSDDFMFWRVSTNPHDPTSWGSEQSVDASGSNSSNASYNNLYYLPNDNGGAGRLYDFTRALDWNPAILVSHDHGTSWSHAGKLLSASGARPYLRYFSDGDRIHFTATDGHPRDENNNIYHGYIQDGQLFNSSGTLLDGDLFNVSAVGPSSLTTVFAANTVVNGDPMTRAWNIDVAIDSGGNPYTVFQARIDPGGLSGGEDSLDHQFFYARYDDLLDAWSVHSLAAAGRDIYAASPNGHEDDYTGLVALDPDDPDTLYISTDVDPTDGAALAHYEIFRGVTSDGGANWSWEPITANSTMDNVRPIVPQWDTENTALLWMRGTYSTYTSWSTEVVALLETTASQGTGVPFCFGDPGGYPCPCGNQNNDSNPGSGCRNGVAPAGARLVGQGSPAVGADTVQLMVTGLEPNNFGLFFQANNALGAGPFLGDGLRCAGGGMIRIEPRLADMFGMVESTVAISTAGSCQPGDTKRYQYWYRNPTNSPCGADQNTSNGYEIVWQP